jgi:hypothetical protein
MYSSIIIVVGVVVDNITPNRVIIKP